MLQTLDLFFLLQIRVWKNSVYRYIFCFCVIYLDPEARSLFLDPILSLCIYHPVLKLHIEVCLPWAWEGWDKDLTCMLLAPMLVTLGIHRTCGLE